MSAAICRKCYRIIPRRATNAVDTCPDCAQDDLEEVSRGQEKNTP